MGYALELAGGIGVANSTRRPTHSNSILLLLMPIHRCRIHIAKKARTNVQSSTCFLLVHETEPMHVFCQTFFINAANITSKLQNAYARMAIQRAHASFQKYRNLSRGRSHKALDHLEMT